MECGRHVARRRHVVVVGRTCPRSILASHVDLEKRVARVSSSIFACDSVPIVMVLDLAAVRAGYD